jgi:glycosyltransferase involved in cell wall biosynthesis
MACGKPVVATNVGGNPEIVTTQTGKLVPFGDFKAAAEAIKAFITNKSLSISSGIAGRIFVENKFSLEKHAQQMCSLFSRLVE